MLCRFVLVCCWHIRCLSTAALVTVLRRHVAAVIRVGLLRFEGRCALSHRPSALSSVAPPSGRLPVLGHSSQLREIPALAIEDLSVHVGWPVVVQFGAIRLPALSERHPLGACVWVSYEPDGVADDVVVLYAGFVTPADGIRRRFECRSKLECEWIHQCRPFTSDFQIGVSHCGADRSAASIERWR